MSYPLVSVIIPTYNRPDYLKLSIESVLRQTFKDFEIIVIDDGTPSIENEILCNKFGGIKYLKITNSGGPAKPRNEGIRLAKGKYIAFLDDDDLWHPDKLKIQIDVIENNMDYGLVHSCCEVIDEKGIKKKQVIGRPGHPGVKHGDVKLRMMGNWTLMTPTPLLRTSLIEQVGYFNENMPAAGEDREYWTRCSFYTKLYYVDTPLAYYREHLKSVSSISNEYINLPLFLKQALDKEWIKDNVEKKDYNLLLNNILFMQAKMIRKDFMKTVLNLFTLDVFWFLNFRIFKIIITKYLK